MRKAVAMVAARLEATAPPQQYLTRARAKLRQHPKNQKLPSPANGSKQRRIHRLQQISTRPTNTKRSAWLPVRRVEKQYEGSQKAGIPVVDSRPGTKRSKAGRKRKDTRKGRPGRGALKEKSCMDEPELLNQQTRNSRPPNT